MGSGVDVIELTLPARAEYIGVARLTVSGIANRAGLPYDDIEDVKLAVAEACTNAVEHAYGGKGTGRIFMRCAVHEDRLVIVVADDGGSFDIADIQKKLKPIDRSVPIEEMTEGGLGLYLIHSVMDEVHITGDEGVVISMTKYLRRDEVADNGGSISKQAN
ncbi:anti-sigma B factor RsbW [Brevibacillus sp. SYP-B805]|uniref:anti-sigma B factor RsbW n=1 Tax=Brevibacillus sp. SYP-B805 TaxID=1578199 RepID=UPI0013EE39BA|nr:anti-sigma B factor RsbW [Brevibacillus sp. SYP-B805]NGQ96052.1 anti-sigma B factor RsbW [Brevibacillus sp. SYP-B805]